jgi:hypothetical protein
LQSQALELIESKLVSEASSFYSKISNAIIKLFLEKKEPLKKLIINYKTNLTLNVK